MALVCLERTKVSLSRMALHRTIHFAFTSSCAMNYIIADKNPRPTISSPRDFEHTVHVGFDPKTGEFTVSNM